MEEEKKLYPFKFSVIEDVFPWGTETYHLADLGWKESAVKNGWLTFNTLDEVMDMYMDRVTGEEVFAWYGRQFPVGVKVLDVTGRTPLVVHPDDGTAEQRYDSLGKSKLWYILDAASGADISIGFCRDTDASQVVSKCGDCSVSDILNHTKPRKGDCFLIRPGTVSSASGKVKILEISEASALDFCLCAWGGEVGEDEFDPSLTIVEALDFIDYKASPVTRVSGAELAREQEFKVTKIDLPEPLQIKSPEGGSFAVYTCIKGEAVIEAPKGEDIEKCVVSAGGSVLVPAEMSEFYLIPAKEGTVLLETMVQRETDEDAYIDPSAEPLLPEDEGEEYKFNSIYGRFSKN